MKLRLLSLLALFAAFALNSAATAAPPSILPAAPAAVQAEAVQTVASSKEEAAALLKKKKKLAAEAKAKEKARKLAEKAKADEKKKQQAIAKAKADEKAKLAAKAKAEKEKKLAAKAKADEASRLARAKAAEERKVANAKAAEERKIAKLKAAEDRRLKLLAKAQAKEDQRLAVARAAEEKRLAAAQAAESARQAEIQRLASSEIARTGNNGELRSESVVEAPRQQGLFAGLFGGGAVHKQSMLPETRALDAALELKDAKKKFIVRPEFQPQTVSFSGYRSGTIVIDTASRFLYLVESSTRARRYAIAVGREGLQYKGQVAVGDKQEWPRWIPTKEMQQREPKKYGQYKDGMPGGGQNPLGARAIYLYEGKKDTHLRIHGTIAPETIGTDSSNGCFRMINEHVMDLYRRVPVGTPVVVL